MQYEKPPIGIMPRYIYESNRINDILSAIERYTEKGIPIPMEWIEELKELFTSFSRHLIENHFC